MAYGDLLIRVLYYFLLCYCVYCLLLKDEIVLSQWSVLVKICFLFVSISCKYSWGAKREHSAQTCSQMTVSSAQRRKTKLLPGLLWCWSVPPHDLLRWLLLTPTKKSEISLPYSQNSEKNKVKKDKKLSSIAWSKSL